MSFSRFVIVVVSIKLNFGLKSRNWIIRGPRNVVRFCCIVNYCMCSQCKDVVGKETV